MMKSFLLAAVVALMAAMPVHHAFANDDVFLEEGDGGFDNPAPGLSEPGPVGDDPFVTGEAAPSNAPAPAPVVSQPMEEQLAPPPVAEPARVAAKPKKEAPAKAKPAAHVAAKPKKEAPEHKASHKVAKGSFQTTQEACPMMRSPASTGSPKLVVKPARRVWVEEEDRNWVKAYDRNGKPGYLNRGCFK